MKQFFLLILTVSSMMGAINDVFPTDYVANKSGDITTTLYFKESDGNGYYHNSEKLINDSVAITTQALRLGYTTKFFEYTTALVAVGSYAKTEFKGSVVEAIYPQTTSGIGDIRLGITTWLINNPSEMEYFAITPMVSLPSGTYDSSHAINIGENRYKGTLSAGYVNRFMNNDMGELFLELSPELAIYGNNDNAQGQKIEQKPSYSLTGYLRYRPVPMMGIFTGYQINHGGETILNGVEQNDQPNNTRFMFGGALFLYGTQIIVRQARDTHLQSGFKTGDETTVRLQWIFSN